MFFYLTTHSTYFICGYMEPESKRKPTSTTSGSTLSVCTISDRITHTTTFVTPVMQHWLEWEIAQWVHHERSNRRPIAPWANALTTEIYLDPRLKEWYIIKQSWLLVFWAAGKQQCLTSLVLYLPSVVMMNPTSEDRNLVLKNVRRPMTADTLKISVSPPLSSIPMFTCFCHACTR